MNRDKLLLQLVNFEQPIADTVSLLNQYSWDSGEVLVTIEKDHVINICDRYLKGELSADDVENWANAIEGREDLEYQVNFADLLHELIFTLANPILTGPWSREKAHEWLIKLGVDVVSKPLLQLV